MDTIELTLHLSHGSSGIDDDPNNPLSRALNQLIMDGRPFNALSLCFYTSADLLQPQPVRWLGAIVHSTGNRIVFFPGFSFSSDWLRSYRGSALYSHSSFQVDHLSLDDGFQRWHFTTPGSVDHRAAGRTEDLGEGRFLWFGMSIADDAQLREMRSETIVRATAPPSDIERRLNRLMAAHDQGTYHAISLDPRAISQPEPSFLHFSFIVSPPDAPIYLGERHMIPFGSPFVAGELPNPLKGLPLRAHQVRLTQSVSTQITAMRLPGSLTVPVTYTNPG